MQNYCKTIGALAAASALVAGTAMAEVEYELSAGYTNQYLFRGIEQGNDLTEVGLGASTTYNGIDLSASVWNGTYETSTTSNIDETDIVAEASKDLGFATGSIGYIWYTYDSEVEDAQEVYFGLSRELAYGINGKLTYFWDIEGDNNGYAELGLSREFEINTCTNLEVATAVGYAVEEGEFANWVTSATINYAFSETATLSPFVMVAIGGPEDSGYSSDSQNELVGGAKLSVSF